MESAILAGIMIHAIGGLSASTCYISQKGAPKWSWQTYWIIVSITAWFLMPLIVSCFAVPDLLAVLKAVPPRTACVIMLLGALYGFGGMAFGVSIRNIGFSLTYAIAIGISAVFGTVVPQVLSGTLIASFQKPGGMVVLIGFIVSMIGVAICGKAGFMKEGETVAGGESSQEGDMPIFNMKKGLALAMFSGVLSGVFGVAVAGGVAIDQLAIDIGGASAGGFAGYVKYIFITGGCLITNLIWWGIVCVKKKSLHEFVRHEDGFGKLSFYYLMGIIAGMLWFGQFLFYELGHARMGDFKFISWGIHMGMLVFFSFGVGLILKEWNKCHKKTLVALTIGLIILICSFSVITYGSLLGQKDVVTDHQATEASAKH